MRTMVTSAVARMRSTRAGGMAPLAAPSRASTKENSPTWARARPASTATGPGSPRARTTTTMIAVLPTTTAAVSRATWEALASRARGSIRSPMETKKREANRSRRGNTSATTWAR